ncbi:Uncharacterised protein [uncultured archaeon]|nr:Uncharacterised protein [uncultured archaeon]
MVKPDLPTPIITRNNLNQFNTNNIDPREKMSSLINLFLEFYRAKGYFEQEYVKITAGIDPTVHFIGSHISVYKKYLIKAKIPDIGCCMAQKCIRNHNLNNYLKKNQISKYSSYFYSLGLLTSSKRLDMACAEFFEFLTTKLMINPNNIKLRILSKDESLVQACIKAGMQNNLELDTKPNIYYTHKLGMVDYIGHSFNFAIWDEKLKEFSDVGNIILIKHKNDDIAVEVAFGAGIMIKTILGLDHVLDCYTLQGLENQETSLRRKFEDVIITTVALYEDGLRPKNSPTKNRILGTYVKLLSYFRKKTNMSIMDLSNILSCFLYKEFPTATQDVTKDIIKYIINFEKKTIISTEFYKKIESIS